MKFNGTCFIEKKQDKPFLHFVGGNKEFTDFLNKICDDGKEYSVEIKPVGRNTKENSEYWLLLEAIDDQSDIIPTYIVGEDLRKDILHEHFKELYAVEVLRQVGVEFNGKIYYQFNSTKFDKCPQDVFTNYYNFVKSWVVFHKRCTYRELIDNYKNRI